MDEPDPSQRGAFPFGGVLRLEDARFDSPRERAVHKRYWKDEISELKRLRNEDLLEANDNLLLVLMSRWTEEVSDLLAHIEDMVHPRSFEEIGADDFAAVKELLERP